MSTTKVNLETEQSGSPFQRSRRTARSPAPQRLSELPVDGSTNIPSPTTVAPVTPSTDGPAPSTPMSPEERDVEMARNRVDEELKRMRDTLLSMRAATLRQKNISADVKNGLDKLDESLDVIQSMRGLWKVSKQRLRNHSKSTQAPSPSFQSSQKRVAASPPLTEQEEKRKKEDGEAANSEWRHVVGRKRKPKDKAPKATEALKSEGQVSAPSKKKRRQRKPRTEAILIKPAAGKTFAEVLGDIRTKVNPASVGAEVRSLRKTRTGDVLVELGPGTKGKTELGDTLRSTLAATATVRIVEPRASVELRDLDELTTETEVTTAVHAALETSAELKVSVSKANSRGQKMAVVTLPVKDADTLLAKGHLKIGWVSCRIRTRLVVPRCFRCLGFGHVAGTCSGPDRAKSCFKCGSESHKASTCSETPSCFLCVAAGAKPEDSGHTSGSGSCRVFKEALEKKKSTRKR